MEEKRAERRSATKFFRSKFTHKCTNTTIQAYDGTFRGGQRSTISPTPHVQSFKRDAAAAKGAYMIHESFSCTINKKNS